MTFSIGEYVWTVETHDGYPTVQHGRVLAIGPEILLVFWNGPYTNMAAFEASVAVGRARKGMAPPGLPGESSPDRGQRCLEILTRERDIDKLRTEAARFGFTLTPVKP